MALTGVRTHTVRGYRSGTPHLQGTDLIYVMNNGTRSGESNSFTAGSSGTFLGKALNFAGNKGALREVPVARRNRVFVPPLP